MTTDLSIGSRMFDHLEENFKSASELPLGNLPDSCEAISKEIDTATEAFLFEALLGFLAKQGTKIPSIAQDRVFVWCGVTYVFSARPGPRGSESFCLVIAAADKNRSKLELLDLFLELSQAVPFRRLVTMTEPDMTSVAKHLSSLSKESLDAGYTWLEEFCIKAVERDGDLIVDELYRVVRSVLPEHCTNSVWLYVLTKNHSVYVFDKIAQRAALNSAKNIGSRFDRSPADTMSKLAGKVATPENTSDFRVVIPADKPYFHNPINGVNEGDEIALPQYILFGGKEHCIQPLVGKETGSLDGNVIWLTAVYPIPMRESIEGCLKAARPRLARILRDHRSLNRTVANKVRSKIAAGTMAQWSEIVAPIVREVLKALADIAKKA